MSFPKISANKVAVSYAEYDTGIVLDVDFNRHISINQTEFIIFNDLEDAKNDCLSKVSLNPKIECHIYDCNEKEILTIDKKSL